MAEGRIVSLFGEEYEPRPVNIVQPRPYQSEAVESVFGEWASGQAATLVCMPTGTGKSVVFSEVLRRWLAAS